MDTLFFYALFFEKLLPGITLSYGYDCFFDDLHFTFQVS